MMLRSILGKAPAEANDADIVVVSLNIGGRNTNPLEFFLDGDDSEVLPRLERDLRAQLEAAEVRRAQEAVEEEVPRDALLPAVRHRLPAHLVRNGIELAESASHKA